MIPFRAKRGPEMMDDGPWMALWSEAEPWTQEETHDKQVPTARAHWCKMNHADDEKTDTAANSCWIRFTAAFCPTASQRALQPIPAPVVTG